MEDFNNCIDEVDAIDDDNEDDDDGEDDADDDDDNDDDDEDADMDREVTNETMDYGDPDRVSSSEEDAGEEEPEEGDQEEDEEEEEEDPVAALEALKRSAFAKYMKEGEEYDITAQHQKAFMKAAYGYDRKGVLKETPKSKKQED